MSLIRVGVLRGGPSKEYEVSIKTGQHILNLLNREPLCDSFKGIDILIDKDSVWHIDGLPMTPEMALRRVDVVFNAMKGEFGEDGKLQRMLEMFSTPYIGSGPYSSALTLNKAMAKKQFKAHGIKTPYHRELNLPNGENLEPIAHDLFKTFPMPVVVKPVGQGSSLGVSFASNIKELVEALDHARGFSNEVIVEEHITGKEIISGFIDDFRGQDLYHLFPVEVKPHKGQILSDYAHEIFNNEGSVKEILSDPEADLKTAEVTVEDLSPEEQLLANRIAEKKKQRLSDHEAVFDWSKKYSGSYDHSSPTSLTPAEKKSIYESITGIKKAFNLEHFATADFIVHPRRGVYVLEVNAAPHMHEHSAVYKSLDAAGIKHHEFLEHLIRLALKRGK